MLKLKILACKEQVYKPQDGKPERVYYTLTVLMPDGDTAKINSSTKATQGQSAILTPQVDRKTGGLVLRCTDIQA